MKIQDPDAELIREFQAGSVEAFNDLVRRHQAAVCRMAYRVIGQQEESRDIAQEVFIKAHQMLPKWRFKAKFFTWLYQTTWNLARNWRRKHSRLDYYEYIGEHKELQTHPEAQVGMHYQEQKAMIKRVLGQLPKRQHQVVLLRIYERLSVEDTAAVMQCRPGTVKALLNQAMKRLSQIVKKEQTYDEMSA